MSDSPKKTIWSLQDNKRSDKERNAFKPTGKKPKNKTLTYVLVVVLVLLLFSFLLIQINDDTLKTCLTSTYCINSQDDVLFYTLYVFFNIAIVILAIFGAYIVGKKLGNYFKV